MRWLALSLLMAAVPVSTLAQLPDRPEVRGSPTIEVSPAAPGSAGGDRPPGGCDLCAPPQIPAPVSQPPPSQPSTSPSVSGQLIVGLPMASPAAVATVVRDLEARLSLRRLAIAGLQSIGAELVLLEISGTQTVAAALAALTADPRVLFSEPNMIFVTAAEHNDPLASLQYGPTQIRIPPVHDHVTGRAVKVAVIDTGIDPTHQDLSGRLGLRANFADGNDGAEVHGTAIAGVIAAAADNGIGIYGVAPDAALLALRACRPRALGATEGTCTAYDLGRAIDFAVVNRARVLNLSLAGPRDSLMPRLLAAAHARGVVVVAAAGNAGPGAPPPYPAAIETVIAVTAVDARGGLYPAAVQGSFVSLAAPGMEVLTTSPGDQYAARTGTSIAAAHVSGTVALILQARPDLLPPAVRSLLEGTAQPLAGTGASPQFGHGLVDGCRAVGRALGRQGGC